MTKKGEPSYADLVYQVLRVTERPLSVREILQEVESLRPVTTRDPDATIRSVLSQGRQLVSTGDGRYGYFPNLLKGSLLRLPLVGKKPASEPLSFPIDVLMALWPGWIEIQKRKLTRPALLRLPNGEETGLALKFFGGVWGSEMTDLLRRFLMQNRAGDGSSLLIRVVDAVEGRYDIYFESHVKRDRPAIARRNDEIADAVCKLFDRNPSGELASLDLAVVLPSRGLYRDEPAPDPLETVLNNDRRFVDTYFGVWRLAATVTPEFEAAIRARKRRVEGMHELEDPTSSDAGDSTESFDVTAFRRSMERSLFDFSAFPSNQSPSAADEAKSPLGEAMSHLQVPKRKLRPALDQAQDIVYDAWECTNPRERVRMARKALSISSDCADAYVVLAEEAGNVPEAADLYAKGVAAGKRALGAEFDGYVGAFWSAIRTRPYMRARCGLAQSLWALNRRKEAIAHAWDMLRLNPGDNQGMRYLLLSWLLKTGDDASAKRLLERYSGDITAIWAYGAALLAFRSGGDTEHARSLRDRAKTVNAFVPDYISRRKRLPAELPESFGFGDESEAMICAEEQAEVWRKTRGAVAWLGSEER